MYVILSGANQTASNALGFAIVFYALFPYAVIQKLFGPKIELRLWEKDNMTEASIRPRTFGLVIDLYFILVLVSSFVASTMAHNTGLQIMSFISLVGVLVFLMDTYAVKITYDGNCLKYTKFTRIRCIPKNEVLKVSWQRKVRTLGYVLVIYLRNGKCIELKQKRFVGLRTLADWLRGLY